MKSFLLICLIGLTAVSALPAKKDEVEVIEGSYGGQPIVDTGILIPDFPSFDYFQGLMTRLRQQMESILHSIPFSRGNSSDTDFPGLSVGFPQFPPLDLGKGNTTSVTKVIDGHKVVINETVYKKEDDFGGSYFKVKIIDVLPNDNETSLPDIPSVETQTEVQIKKDREPLENSVENEIPKGEVGKASAPEKLQAA